MTLDQALSDLARVEPEDLAAQMRSALDGAIYLLGGVSTAPSQLDCPPLSWPDPGRVAGRSYWPMLREGERGQLAYPSPGGRAGRDRRGP